ncbi:MAG: hypothetical protein ACREE9_05105 [Stellaceae bacterium]
MAAGGRGSNEHRAGHFDAEMVALGLSELKPASGSVMFIENVSNLVCPALSDLGEHKRVAILSVTKGDDKPLKYPHMFRAAHLMLLNKIDLLDTWTSTPGRSLTRNRSTQTSKYCEFPRGSAQLCPNGKSGSRGIKRKPAPRYSSDVLFPHRVPDL